MCEFHVCFEEKRASAVSLKDRWKAEEREKDIYRARSKQVGVMAKCYVFGWRVLVTQVYAIIKTYWIVHLKSVCHRIYILSKKKKNNNAELDRNECSS